MTNSYFELNELCPRQHLPADGKYFAHYSVRSQNGIAYLGSNLREFMLWSDRIWQEEDNGVVSYTKNRFADNWQTALVDMKELFWIKLRCHTL
jgi:hypothetical protein